MPKTDELDARAVYDKHRRMQSIEYEGLGRGSRGRGYGNPNTRVHHDGHVERKAKAWREANPTVDDVDDSFGRILEDFFSGIGTLGRSGFGGGRKLLECIVELMKSQVIQVTPSQTDRQ